MVKEKEWLTQHVFGIYKQNPYVNLLDINLEQLDEGYAELSMPIMNKHTNLYNVAHGGALASLADTCMGVACATTGKKVVTLEMNMNFIKGAVPQLENNCIIMTWIEECPALEQYRAFLFTQSESITLS